VQKAATISQINNFGQTPKQLFDKPHPKRAVYTVPTPFYTHTPIYSMVVREKSEAVGQIRQTGDSRVIAMGLNKLLLPPSYNKHIAWGLPDFSVRIMQGDKLVHIMENDHDGQITCCACTEDGRVCVSGSVDTVVCVYKIQRDKQFVLAKRLCGHTARITCLAACRPYSVIVSGSEDQTCIIWDLNRLTYVRQLANHDGPVANITVHDETGNIVTCSGNVVKIWTINGDFLISSNVSQNSMDAISVCVWSKAPEWLHENVLITGHKDGKIKVWVLESQEIASKKLQNVLLQKTSLMNGLHTSPISSLYLSTDSQRLFSGDMAGRIVCWAETDLSNKPKPWSLANASELMNMVKTAAIAGRESIKDLSTNTTS